VAVRVLGIVISVGVISTADTFVSKTEFSPDEKSFLIEDKFSVLDQVDNNDSAIFSINFKVIAKSNWVFGFVKTVVPAVMDKDRLAHLREGKPTSDFMFGVDQIVRLLGKAAITHWVERELVN